MKIVVLGGGTAGWLTALFVKKFFKNSKVTLIESDKIGILGAGEGSTPNFSFIIKQLDIDEEDFLINTKSTIKEGIDFINWKGDNTKYLHDFQGNHGYHFDARLVADYFKNIAISRKINHIIGDVDSFKKYKDNIFELSLEDNTKIDIDFIFDCSGFYRRLLGKELNAEWVDTTEYLTVDSAIPFFLPMEDDLNIKSITRTNAIAMKYGWMWQIPLQHRWGCGYVFDSRYIDSEDAKTEVEEYLGHPIDSPRTIKFKSGYYKDVWIGNCIATGLASSFFEPLEATSLMGVIVQLQILGQLGISYKNRDTYNRLIENKNKEILSFIRHHYICDKLDTQFWMDLKNNKIPNESSEFYNKNMFLKNKDIFNKLINNFFIDIEYSKLAFMYGNYLLVENGNRIINSSKHII
jgi:tryptophan halogenase